ncbi:MAG: HEAT repeat domain-containing protein [Verrucomicrobiales bacterium]
MNTNNSTLITTLAVLLVLAVVFLISRPNEDAHLLAQLDELVEHGELRTAMLTLDKALAGDPGQLGLHRHRILMFLAMNTSDAPSMAASAFRDLVAASQGEEKDFEGILHAALRHHSAKVRENAAKTVSLLRWSHCNNRLCSLVQDPSVEVRLAAVSALRAMPRDSSFLHLVMATKDAEWSVRAEAVEGLAALGDSRATRYLMTLFQDRDAFVVREAVSTFFELVSPAEEHWLNKGVQQPRNEVEHLSAVVALHQIGRNSKPIKELRETLASADQKHDAYRNAMDFLPAPQQSLLLEELGSILLPATESERPSARRVSSIGTQFAQAGTLSSSPQ